MTIAKKSISGLDPVLYERRSRLKSKYRRRMFAELAKLNEILAQYPIETFDDYQLIAEEDLRAIVATFKGFAQFKV